MIAAMDLSGNPHRSMPKPPGPKLVEDARVAIAGAVGALRATSSLLGGTEANALALTPGLRRASGLPVQS